MQAVRTLLALSVAALATACAGPGHMNAASSQLGMAPMSMGASGSMAMTEPRMKAMHEMHLKMKNARTPAERQALMADHMKAMQDGLAMLKEMHAKHADGMGMGMMGSRGSAGATASSGDGKSMPAAMPQQQSMMAQHMATMQMMLDMMSDRMSPAAPAQ